jgi:hypothetical protein
VSPAPSSGRASSGALVASEDRFRAMCDASPLGIFLAARAATAFT